MSVRRDKGNHRSQPRPDRLTTALTLTALVLTAAITALVADLVLRPELPRGSVAAGNDTASLAARATIAPPEAATRVAVFTGTPVPTPSPEIAATLEAITPAPCVPPDDWGIYLVQSGNTLYSLAQRFGTDVETLMRVNCLNTTTIFIDQRMYVPGLLPTVTLPTLAPSVLPDATAGAGGTSTPAAEDVALGAPATPAAPPRVPGALQLDMPERYLNIVLLGSDKRPTSGAWRTDSMIVVSVDSENQVVRLLSIPRDLWVFIPGHGYNRINTADLWGELAKKGSGPERVKQTIQFNLGIPIHYYVRVDFRGFMKIIDTVGGVDIDVDCPLPDIKLTAGMHHMNGAQALQYSRSRYSTNDFDRARRQRKVLLSLWEQALNLDLIPKLPALWRQMSDSYQTDLPLDQVINLAYVGARLKPQRILNRAIGPGQVESWITPGGASVLLPQADRIRALLEAYYAPAIPATLDAGEKVRVVVLNGAQRNEADQLAAAALRWGGFKVVSASPGEDRSQATSTIRVYTGNLPAAAETAELLGLPPGAVQDLTGVEAPPSASEPIDLVVVLGQDYNPCNR